MLNSITACDLPIASICPARSAVFSFCALTSVANFTTLKGLPVVVEDRIVGRENPDLLAALAEPLVFRRLELATVEARPEFAIGGAVALAGVDEHAVMLALDFGQRIADRFQEIFVGGDDGAVEIEFDHRLRAADRRDHAGIFHAAEFLRGDVGGELDDLAAVCRCRRESDCRRPESRFRGRPWRSACIPPPEILRG